MFDQADADKDGKLSKDELTKVIGEQMRRMGGGQGGRGGEGGRGPEGGRGGEGERPRRPTSE